ncbi:hypothetical protein GCM10010168_32360 [Actinoplanes ianthinogenes]|nr:hypothetical protein GCM10010168_32360 [Actinoplanes ianthinogenes]
MKSSDSPGKNGTLTTASKSGKFRDPRRFRVRLGLKKVIRAAAGKLLIRGGAAPLRQGKRPGQSPIRSGFRMNSHE